MSSRARLLPSLALLLSSAVVGPVSAQESSVRLDPSAPARAVPPYVQVESIADSTYVLRAGTANVTAFLTAAGWVLVDTGTRAEAMPIRNELARISTARIAAVFNTHFHDDHAGGNAVYRGMGVPVYASAATESLEAEFLARIESGAPREIARLDSAIAATPAGPDKDRIVAFYEFMQRWWREGAAEARRDPQFVVPADRTFRRNTTVHVGGLAFEARAFTGPAHTRGDIVVYVRARKVAAVGDVVMAGGAPWADRFMGDGSPVGLLAAQGELLGRFPAADTTWRIVPGHGRVLRRGDIAAARTALAAVRTCARKAFDAGLDAPSTAEGCAHTGFSGGGGAYAAWLFHEEWRTASATKSKSTRSAAAKP